MRWRCGEEREVNVSGTRVLYGERRAVVESLLLFGHGLHQGVDRLGVGGVIGEVFGFVGVLSQTWKCWRYVLPVLLGQFLRRLSPKVYVFNAKH